MYQKAKGAEYMFVYTLRATGIKFFAAIAVSVALLTAIIGILPSVSAAVDVAAVNTEFGNIDSTDDMVEFLSTLGYTVENTPVSTIEITIPEEFDAVFEEYNRVQRAQGLNLKRYLGKTATVYVFRVCEYDYDGEVFATLFIRNGRIIAGDVCSCDGEGFVKGF